MNFAYTCVYPLNRELGLDTFKPVLCTVVQDVHSEAACMPVSRGTCRQRTQLFLRDMLEHVYHTGRPQYMNYRLARITVEYSTYL